jgi:hypothetical protein
MHSVTQIATSMFWKTLASLVAIFCSVSGTYYVALSICYVIAALHAPGNNELQEGAILALALSLPSWGALYWLAHSFRQALPKPAVLAAKIPATAVFVVFSCAILIGLAWAAILLLLP